MYDEMLLPVDENTETSGLLHHAAEIAHWADAEVTLLYVADTTRDSVTVADGEVLDALVESGEEVVEEASRVLESLGADYTTDVVQGAPAETIVEYAERYEYDLVAMPTHGRDGLSRYLLGSTTEKVVRLSPVPVLTAHVEEEAFSFPYERILLPTDGSESAGRAADHALELAGALDATLHALSVTEDSLLGEDADTSTAEEAIDAVTDAAERHGVENVETHIEAGEPDEVILEYVEERNLDAIVMGATGRRGIDRVLLGSVAEKTVRSATVPVVTVGEE
jgi:nucleotide-binding universal stress UspA family protein